MKIRAERAVMFHFLCLSALLGAVLAGSRCPLYQMDCHGIFRTCLDQENICDGRVDCRSALDENFCECTSS